MSEQQKRFCDLAREQVNEEMTGNKIYEQLHNRLSDWHSVEENEAKKLELQAIANKIEEIKADERGHASTLAVIIANHCPKEVTG